MDRGGELARGRYGVLLVATVTYTLLMFIWFSLPAYLSAIIEELSLSGTQAGIVVGAIPLTYIPLGLLSGLTVDRLGPGRSLAAGTVLFGAAQAGRSLATGFPSLLLSTLVIGVGATAITFGLPKLVSALFQPANTGLPSSMYLIGAQVGSIVAFGLGRSTIGPALGGWRPLFYWSGLLAVGYGIAWFLLASRLGLDGGNREPEGADPTVNRLAADLLAVLSHRELRLIVVIGTMYLFVTHGLQGWLPTVLEAGGFAPAVAGRITSVYVGGMIVGIFTIPTVADRIGARRPALAVSGGIIVVGVVGILLAEAILVASLAVALAGLGTGGLSPMIRAIPPELEGIGARLTGTAVGFVFAVGEIGGFLGPVLIGGIHEWTGSFRPGLGLLAVAGIVVVFSGEALRRR